MTPYLICLYVYALVAVGILIYWAFSADEFSRAVEKCVQKMNEDAESDLDVVPDVVVKVIYALAMAGGVLVWPLIFASLLVGTCLNVMTRCRVLARMFWRKKRPRPIRSPI